MDDIPSELADFADLGVHRDLVFVEQRGTGQSSPLYCPAFPGSLAEQAALQASVRSCVAHLHGDLRFYTTAMYVDDVNQVLGDLHYAKANLMGISYGTAVEQVFLLRHPDRVRTMTFQGGTPLNVPLWERRPGNAQLALDYTFARCESQPACHQAFPHLAADWASLWASLGKSPWVLPAAQSPTKTTQRIDQDGLAISVYQALYDYHQGLIPVVIHTLATAKDKAAAITAVINVAQASAPAPADSGGEQMMADEIECVEPWSSQRPAALSDQRDSFYYHLGLGIAQWYQLVCPLIPKSSAAVGDQHLTVSNVPVLAFNGAGDPIDPPSNMARAQRFWPNSRDIALPGQGHDVDSGSWAACAGPLTQAFIEQASVAHLDTSCLATAPTPVFALTLS